MSEAILSPWTKSEETAAAPMYTDALDHKKSPPPRAPHGRGDYLFTRDVPRFRWCGC